MQRLCSLIAFFVVAWGEHGAPSAPDRITSLPGYGEVRRTMYAGMVDGNASYSKKMFYWFVEAAESVPGKTPLLIWMNGGPGASSLTGLLAENIGPIALKLQLGGGVKLQDNPDAWTERYHVIVIDNPVGSGFSCTRKGGWVTSQEQMRHEYHDALSVFMALHPEYRSNPVWVTGESYGGKYVPNVAWEIHLRRELNLQGVMIGNGMYDMRFQYPPVADFAYNAGVIDDTMYETAQGKLKRCVELIEGQQLVEAKVFCEASVDWIFDSNLTGAGVFKYDVGMQDGKFFDDLTDAMGAWLNSEDTRKALHVGDGCGVGTSPPSGSWTQADETGPVSDALANDFVTNQSNIVVGDLLGAGYKVAEYNGVRDGSLCNHVGNLRALRAVQWHGANGFAVAPSLAFMVDGSLAGYLRQHDNLRYYTLLRTGHLVPTVVPAVSRAMVDAVVGHWQDEQRATVFA